MSLDDFKMFFAGVFLVLILVVASPTLSMIVDWPVGERFTELWILGPGHMAEDYPFNVTENEVYSVFLGIGNHMRGLEYYVVYVKVRNQTELLPNATTGEPSTVVPLYEYRVFLSEGEVWEKNVTFSFSGIAVVGNVCRVSYLWVDGFRFSVNKTAVRNEEDRGFYFQVFFELWRLDEATSEFQYHNRFVGLWLNMTTFL